MALKTEKSFVNDIIKEISNDFQGDIDLVIVGSVSAVIGYGMQKYTLDVDSYNSIPQDFQRKWTNACQKLGYDLKLTTTSVFTPPDHFEERLKLSDISTDRIKVYYLDKYDFAISKIARGNEKDISDIVELNNLSLLDAETLYKRFIEEFLFVSAIGSLNMAALSFLNLVTLLAGETQAFKLEQQIKNEMIKRGHSVSF